MLIRKKISQLQPLKFFFASFKTFFFLCNSNHLQRFAIKHKCFKQLWKLTYKKFLNNFFLALNLQNLLLPLYNAHELSFYSLKTFFLLFYFFLFDSQTIFTFFSLKWDLKIFLSFFSSFIILLSLCIINMEDKNWNDLELHFFDFIVGKKLFFSIFVILNFQGLREVFVKGLNVFYFEGYWLEWTVRIFRKDLKGFYQFDD